jgi:hypothetical protein
MGNRGLVGIALIAELHQEHEKMVRQLLRQLIERLKLLADRRLKGAQGAVIRSTRHVR